MENQSQNINMENEAVTSVSATNGSVEDLDLNLVASAAGEEDGASENDNIDESVFTTTEVPDAGPVEEQSQLGLFWEQNSVLIVVFAVVVVGFVVRLVTKKKK